MFLINQSIKKVFLSIILLPPLKNLSVCLNQERNMQRLSTVHFDVRGQKRYRLFHQRKYYYGLGMG